MEAVVGFLSGLTVWHWVGLGIVLMAIEVAVNIDVRTLLDSTFPSAVAAILADGDVVEILTNKSQYNTLELTSGRMAKVSRGDVIVGALGHRQALFGYSGHVPKSVKAGDIIQMLNIGGVLGICDSANPDRGKPFDCRVLGVVLRRPRLRRVHPLEHGARHVLLRQHQHHLRHVHRLACARHRRARGRDAAGAPVAEPVRRVRRRL